MNRACQENCVALTKFSAHLEYDLMETEDDELGAIPYVLFRATFNAFGPKLIEKFLFCPPEELKRTAIQVDREEEPMPLQRNTEVAQW